jgi:transcriptional regulator with XRE-family HTH domain
MADYFLSIGDSLAALGARAQELRLSRNLTQRDLATNAGVGLKQLRRFEATGEGTLETAIRVAVALGAQEPFGALFEPPPFKSLAEAEARNAVITRKRARKKKNKTS